MEFLRLVRRRSFLSEVIYIGLNVAFAVVVAIALKFTGSIVLAIALVLLSKWRVFAVRSRYWLANIQTNLVDTIVGVSIVGYMYGVVSSTTLSSLQQWGLLAVVTAVYIIWLVLIKPRSARVYMAAQAGMALFMGTSVLYAVSYNWPAAVVVVVMWVIGYAAARHVLSSYDETHLLPLSLVWGTMMAEIGWVAYHWTVGYQLPGIPGAYVPQISIIVLLLGFGAYKIYNSFYHHQKIRTNDVLLPLTFVICVIAVLLLFFNGIGTTV